MVQKYTSDTSISAYRKDALFRGAVCRALQDKYPGLAAVADESEATVAAIDACRTELRKAEDAVVKARALVVAEKIDVVECYKVLRLTFQAFDADNLFAFLPEPPSVIARAGMKTARDRVREAIGALEVLPEGHRARGELLDDMKREYAEYVVAVDAGDEVQLKLKGVALGLMTYKSELARIRDGALGTIQSVLKDRGKAALFTQPWRRRSGGSSEDDNEAIGEDAGELAEALPTVE